MGYSVDDLKTSFTLMYTTQSVPNTITQHTKDFAKLYDDYAKEVKESNSLNTLITTGKQSFQTTLEGYLAITVPSLEIYANFVELACISYWNSSVFSLTNIPIGWSALGSISITAMATDSIKTSLKSAFVSSNGDVKILSTAISSIIHGATSSVSMTLSGTSLAGNPISVVANLIP